MGRIKALSAELSNQIAAGEVVERPASAVKELVENAIDAAASRCDVSIEGGGITRLLVEDDGIGMDRDDALLCLQRHATSKLFTFSDLTHLGSFGFRGEALPSIASVSRLNLCTRRAEDEVGHELSVEPGKAPILKPLGMAAGTRIRVEDLFFNVPARRKFLRSSGTESGHVSEVLEACALARPDMTFTLTRDGRKTREWLRAPDRERRVRSVLQDDEDLARIRGERGPLQLEAFLSRPERAKSGAAGLRLFVNNRPIRDRALLHTVAQAYGSVLERGRYPRGVVYLDLAPALVDINVHPQKSEVRFADPRALTDAVYAVLAQGLAQAFSLPKPTGNAWAARDRAPRDPGAHLKPMLRAGQPEELLNLTPAAAGSSGHASLSSPAPSPRLWRSASSAANDGREPTAASSQEPLLVAQDTSDAATALAGTPGTGSATTSSSAAEPWSGLNFVAQVKRTYLIAEGRLGLYVIDQHAAAERLTFHRLRREYQARSVAAQAILFPVNVRVTEAESEVARSHEADFRGLGMELTVRSQQLVTLHTTPKLLLRASPEQLFRDLLSEVTRQGRGFSEAVDLGLATMACHGSLRAGDAVSPEQAKAMLAALDEVDFAGHCPHGRPIVTVTSWSDLERRVGRR